MIVSTAIRFCSGFVVISLCFASLCIFFPSFLAVSKYVWMDTHTHTHSVTFSLCWCGIPEQDAEQLAKVHVVRGLFKAQTAAVVQIHGELCWETLNTNSQHVQLKPNTFPRKNPKRPVYIQQCSSGVLVTLQRISTGVDIFFSEIFSYFCFLVAAWGTCRRHQQDSSSQHTVFKADTPMQWYALYKVVS